MDLAPPFFLSRLWAAASQLGAAAVGPEHILLALADGESPVARALRANNSLPSSSVDDRAVVTTQGARGGRDQTRGRRLSVEASLVLARAGGIALAQGRDELDEECILAALIWNDNPPGCLVALETSLGGVSELIQILKAHGVVLPERSPPKRPRLGPQKLLSSLEFAKIAADLTAEGGRFVFNYVDQDTVWFAVEES